MSKFVSKYAEIEANQFLKRGECPLGVRTKEDGTHYVVTAQGQEVVVHEGEWIAIEDPPGDGTRAYPIAPDVFEKRWGSCQYTDDLMSASRYVAVQCLAPFRADDQALLNATKMIYNLVIAQLTEPVKK